MGDPSNFSLECGGVTKQNVLSGQDEFQVFGTVTNLTGQTDSISIRVEAVGPAYPPGSPYEGQENRFRIDSVNSVVGAGQTEAWQTDPETIDLGSFKPTGDYEIRAELRAI